MSTDAVVTDLDLTISADEDVGGLHITVHHLELRLEIVQSFDHLQKQEISINMSANNIKYFLD